MNIKCYHISPSKNRNSILNNGLLPKSKIEGLIQYEPRIFFSTDLSNLGFDFVGFDNVDCWEFEIDSETIKPDNISGSTNHFYITEKIPTSQIRLNELFSV